MKTCIKCNVEKDIEQFGRYNSRSKILYRNSCKKCRVESESKRYNENLDLQLRKKAASRKCMLANKYGITEVDYQLMFTKQEGRCAICKIIPQNTLNIDHCHTTAIVRGLLCWDCNIALGKFKDNIENMKNAIKYLGGTEI